MSGEMNYKEMSDFEINKAVAMGLNERVCDDKPFSNSECVELLQGMRTDSVYADYCNSWADAGDIIEKYGINLNCRNVRDPYQGSGTEAWGADTCYRSSTRRGPIVMHDNPLRAAMIVFLIMELTNATT